MDIPERDSCCGSIYKSAGLRHTRQRHDVMSILQSGEVPLSAGEIYSRLRSAGSRMNLSTVYRTLDTLENCRILRKIGIEPDNTAYYDIARPGHRHYLICLACRKIRSIASCPLKTYEAALSRETDYIIEGHSLSIYGLCPDCAKKDRPTDDPAI